jgi:hypothetical protein
MRSGAGDAAHRHGAAFPANLKGAEMTAKPALQAEFAFVIKLIDENERVRYLSIPGSAIDQIRGRAERIALDRNWQIVEIGKLELVTP